MHVELIGCTGSGKTTLTRALEQTGRARGLTVRNGDDVLLGTLGLAWVEGEFLRRRLVDVVSLPACFSARHAHRELLRFMLDVSRTTPGGWASRVNRARNGLRKLGIYEVVRRRRAAEEHVLVDNEGVLQAAHNLFVHVDSEPDMARVDVFGELACLPDAVVYLRTDLSTVRERTLARGHKRVPRGAVEAAERFVGRATAMFDRLTRHPRVRARLVEAEGNGRVAVAESGADPRLLDLADWVRAGLQAVREERGATSAVRASSTPSGAGA